MYCPNCGKELAENTTFCNNCGANIDADQPDNGKRPRKGNRWWKILLVIIFCAAAVVVFFFVRSGVRAQQFQKHMEIGQDYMNKNSYEGAADEFCAAIKIDPEVVDPYIQLADAYQKQEDTSAAEDTYDDARTIIVKTYDRIEELLEDSDSLYCSAVEEIIESGDDKKTEEILWEYTSMVDEETARDFEKKVEEMRGQKAIDEEDEKEEETQPPSVDTVKDDMIVLFDTWMGYQLTNWYINDEQYQDAVSSAYFASFETIGPFQAYSLSGQILGGIYYRLPIDVKYGLVDGEMIPYSDMSDDQIAQAGDLYLQVNRDDLEAYVRELFGKDCVVEDFSPYEEDNIWSVKADKDGYFYVPTGDYGFYSVDLSIVDISDTPDAEGNYTVLAEYKVHYGEGDDVDIFYVQYRFKPVEDSEYGYVIVGMVPAGHGEINPIYRP